MRSRAFVAIVVATLGACATRDRPYRFSSPMLGMASVPPAPLPGAPPRPRPELANREAAGIRIVTAPTIREASAALAAKVSEAPAAQEHARATLPSPHRIPADTAIPRVRELAELRALVGRRDKRDPVTAALAWARDFGIPTEGTTGADVVLWAEATNRLADPTAAAQPGDLLVFDHANSDTPADLLAIVIARDLRGVTEFVYLGGGVIRRGFVDPARPRTKRDASLTIVNTFLRHGKRWPAKGSHYLAGELLAHVIHTR